MQVPSPTQEPTTGLTPSPTIERSETIVVDGTSWLRFYSAELLTDHRSIHDVWASRGRFLGYAGDGFGLVQSADGQAWSPIGTAPGFILYEDERGFLAGGDGLWLSTDGVDWAALDEQATFRPADCPLGQASRLAMYSAYSIASGVVVVGDLLCGDEPVDRAAWLSTDYEEWQRIAATPMFKVVQVGDVLVGIDTHARIRNSQDGLQWSRPRVTLPNVLILGVGSGFLQVEGWSPGADPDALLTSADGRNWVEQSSPFGGSDRGLAASDGTRAVVFEIGPYEAGPGAMWISSTDGTTWVRYQLPTREGDRAGSIAILGSRIVVVGRLNEAAGVIWVADIP